MSCSSTEAEYHALATTAAKLSSLRTLFKELRIFLTYVPLILCDNVFAIAFSSNPIFHSRTKHLEVDYHFTREKVIRKQLQIGFVSSRDNFADIFTKSLLALSFHLNRSKLLVDSSLINLGGMLKEGRRSLKRSLKKMDKMTAC